MTRGIMPSAQRFQNQPDLSIREFITQVFFYHFQAFLAFAVNRVFDNRYFFFSHDLRDV